MSCADADFLDDSEKSFPTKFGNTTLPEIEAGNRYTRNLLAQIDELISVLEMIAHATSPALEDGGFHENAYSLATEAIAKVKGVSDE